MSASTWPRGLDSFRPVRKLPRLYTNICQLTNLRINVEFFELDGAEIYVTVVAEIVQPLVLVGATHLDEVADELRGLGY